MNLSDFEMPGPGVKFNTPPDPLIPQIKSQLAVALEEVKEGELVMAAIADRQGGWNAALAAKTRGGVNVITWIGKSWGNDQELDWGVKVMKTWKF